MINTANIIAFFIIYLNLNLFRFFFFFFFFHVQHTQHMANTGNDQKPKESEPTTEAAFLNCCYSLRQKEKKKKFKKKII